MIALFRRRKSGALQPLKIPPHCVLCTETESLASKREAQLRWMRERGVKYLGHPMAQAERDRATPSPEASRRVVDIRGPGPGPGNPPRHVDAA